MLARILLVDRGPRCLRVCLLVDCSLVACLSLLACIFFVTLRNVWGVCIRVSLMFTVYITFNAAVPAFPAISALVALSGGRTGDVRVLRGDA